MISVFKDLVDKIANKLVEDHSIEEEDIDAYKFGIEVTILKIVHYVSYFVIALFMEKTFEFVIIFTIFYVFRRNTGGFHAKTRIGCYVFSCVVIFLSLFMTELSLKWWYMITISVVDLVVLFWISPVQHKNRRLDADEIECFQRRLRLISAVFLGVNAVTLGMKGWYGITLYTIGVTTAAVLAVLGRIQYLRQQKNEIIYFENEKKEKMHVPGN